MLAIGSRLRAFLFIVVFLSTAYVRAQEADIPARLTLQDAVRLAIARNPELAAARNEVQAEKGNMVAASKRPNPAATVQTEDFPIRAHPGPLFGTQEITTRIDYEIERGGRRELRTEAAKQALQARQLAYEDRVRLKTLDV